MTATEIGAGVSAGSDAPEGVAATPAPPQAPGITAAAVPPPAAPGRTPASPAPVQRPRSSVLRIVGLVASLIGVLLVGFAIYLYGLSGLSEAHAQSTLYKTLAGQLGAATAPVGVAPGGAPVAILSIPRLGVSGLVVVEGTTSADLTRGPGLLPGSAFPGQPGVSEVYGRAGTFGAPFEHLMRLDRGDHITVVTGEGTSTYSVESFGDSANPAKNPAANQLVLYTAGSAFLATGYEQVTADLISQPMASSGSRGASSAYEAPMAGDTGVAIPLILWSEGLVVAMIGGLLLTRRWSPPMVLLYVTPAALALAWAVYENAAILLPNLY